MDAEGESRSRQCDCTAMSDDEVSKVPQFSFWQMPRTAFKN